MTDAQIIAMPGVTCRHMINKDAANDLQSVVDKLNTGEAVGAAWVYIDSDGHAKCGWNCPDHMGKDIFYGASVMIGEMLTGNRG